MKNWEISEKDKEIQNDFMRRVRALNDGKELYATVQTFGCQQNEADSERIAGMLEAMGYTIVDDPKNADVIMVNTCAIREHAEQRALSITGQFKHL